MRRYTEKIRYNGEFYRELAVCKPVAYKRGNLSGKQK